MLLVGILGLSTYLMGYPPTLITTTQQVRGILSRDVYSTQQVRGILSRDVYSTQQVLKKGVHCNGMEY